MAAKTEKMPFFTIAGPKSTYVRKVPKIIFEKLRENWLILKHVSLEKYLKVVFSTEIVWKIEKFKIEKSWKSKKGQIKKSCFRGL